MKNYEIVIEVTDAGDIYSADSYEEARDIARSVCDDIYNRLNGRATVRVESIQELKD